MILYATKNIDKSSNPGQNIANKKRTRHRVDKVLPLTKQTVL